MKFSDGKYIREYKDLEEKEPERGILPLGRVLEMKLEQAKDWANCAITYIDDLDEDDRELVIEKLNYCGAKDFMDDIPNLIQQIMDLIKE